MKNLVAIAASLVALGSASQASAGSTFWSYSDYDYTRVSFGRPDHHRSYHNGRHHGHDRWRYNHFSTISRPAVYSVRQVQPVVYQPYPVVINNNQMADNGSYCREYQSRVNVGGSVQESYGTACLQPDGSWKIIE